MFDNFLITGQQVLILFIIILIGFICGKTRLLKEEGVKGITDLVLYAVTPCVIIEAFQREFEPEMVKGLIIAAVVAVLSHGLFIAASFLIKDADRRKENVMRFSVIFSNCGYMSLPLQNAVLGSEGLFYGAVYIAVFNIIFWTYGVAIFSDDKKEISVKKIIFNPGIIGTVIGLVLFFNSITLPELIASPIGYMADLNTPLPMIIIGYYLSGLAVSELVISKNEVFVLALRLVILPVIVLTAMYLAGISGALLVSCAISVSAPTATGTTMFAGRFGSDTKLSVKLVSISTILSIFTMTILVGIAETLS